MSENAAPLDEQERRIAETLARIRAGLGRPLAEPFQEPAHLFKPEAFHDQNK